MLNQKKIECVIMDWAGTAIDFGCFAPVDAFVKAFQEINISVCVDEVRIPMGMSKIEHIRQLLRMDNINNQFNNIYNRNWKESDVTGLNKSFEKHLFEKLADYTTPLPGVIETIDILRSQSIKIGSTTGYTRAMMDVVQPCACAKGYETDYCATSDGLPAGRPAPFMIFQNMINLNIQSLDSIVKVGDTAEDIREGLAAKAWTVGVITGSNELGLSESECTAIDKEILTEKKNAVRTKMIDLGAHYVIDSISELPRIIDDINKKI